MIARADLPRGIQAANLVHAAGESSPGNLPSGTFAVVLTTPDEASLAGVADRLTCAGISHTLIHEPSAPYNGALMAIGCTPGDKEVLKRHLSSLPLLR